MTNSKIATAVNEVLFKGVKNPLYFNVFNFSDVHVGHQNTPTEHILGNADKILTDKFMSILDAIFITGDFFEKLLMLPEDRVLQIQAWICKFLIRCKKFNICLRVLEGTGSHDYKQSRMFTTLNESACIGADVKYFSSVVVEDCERFGIKILYVPDNVSHNADEVYKKVLSALNEAGVEKVDFALTHGFFDFQLPVGVHAESAHNSYRYEKLVRYQIFNGHDHTHKIKGKIIVPGSFDRLKQGEEENKGGVHVRYSQTGERQINFIVNTGAKVYKTIEAFGWSIEKLYKHLDKFDFPDHSAICIKAGADDPFKAAIMEIRTRYYRYKIDVVRVKGVNEPTENKLENLTFKYEPISLNRDNLPTLLLSRISKEVLPIAKPLLEQLL